jgi:uncharacterized protein YegL
MSRLVRLHQAVFVSLALATVGASWWGCSGSSQGQTGGGGSSSHGGSGGTGGMSGTGGDLPIEAGADTGDEDDAACTSISAEAHRVPLDIVFLLDRSGSMTGAKWQAATSALSTFFNDPASTGIGAGLVFFPSIKANSCDYTSYQILDVPIDTLPGNAFNLTNAFPYDAQGYGTPSYAALKGALIAATAWQDSHPNHKVILVLATDGDPFACSGGTIDEVAGLAKSARDYDGVLTYVIGMQGATIANLDQIAAAGGTTASYDITNDVTQFSAKVAQIRTGALGCDYEIPPPPNNMQLDPNKVNFSYTPLGKGTPKILPRANDLADCAGQPGWFYDNNAAPTKIILCPASCTTIQNDAQAEVNVLFGCKSLIK